MSRVILFLAILLSIIGCSKDLPVGFQEDLDTLQKENLELKNKVAQQDSLAARTGLGSKFVNAYLDSLEQLELSIREEMTNRKNDSAIVDKIQDITKLLQYNRNIIDGIRESIGKGNLVGQILLDHVLRLNEKVKNQELKIALLNRDLQKIGGELAVALGELTALQTKFELREKDINSYKTQVSELKTELNNKNQIISSKDDELNKAFYFFGSKKELLKLGILKKSNLLTFEIDENINLNQLNEIVIKDFLQLALPKTKIKIMSNHPEGSYRIDETDEFSKIVVTNPKKFWSLTKALIIQTD